MEKKPVIICIDDEDVVLTSLEIELQQAMGTTCRIELAQSGDDAIEMLQEYINENQAISVIISDYIMPGMRGDEALNKAHALVPSARKIMLTGQSSIEGIASAINHANLYRFIAKPWDRQDLALTIKEAHQSFLQHVLVEKQREELAARNKELEEWNASLERKVEDRTREIERERSELALANERLDAEQKKTETLMQNILPLSIAERLKAGETKIAERLENVTILFSDIVGFTKLSSRLSAEEVVTVLDEVFTLFDGIAERYQLEKIKTIGDAYMLVAGVPDPYPDHCATVARAALEMQERLKIFPELLPEIVQRLGTTIHVRIGIHTGAVVAGVIGQKKFAYDLWGDTVNIASRMESHGEAGKVHVSEEVFTLLKDTFAFEKRGEIDIKGKGVMQTWFLVGDGGI
jgi:class 3 adenylate cyclase/CheY-like chemotaxis protein